MKCCIRHYFIWVFTVCQSTHLGVSGLQRVKMLVIRDGIHKMLVRIANREDLHLPHHKKGLDKTVHNLQLE